LKTGVDFFSPVSALFGITKQCIRSGSRHESSGTSQNIAFTAMIKVYFHMFAYPFGNRIVPENGSHLASSSILDTEIPYILFVPYTHTHTHTHTNSACTNLRSYAVTT